MSSLLVQVHSQVRVGPDAANAAEDATMHIPSRKPGVLLELVLSQAEPQRETKRNGITIRTPTSAIWIAFTRPGLPSVTKRIVGLVVP